ncbi:MAG: hypothetical protein IT373_25460 [Polyangiaceae bacterium]|nr:hypothetical protein [Polyangiaceae bacterium]
MHGGTRARAATTRALVAASLALAAACAPGARGPAPPPDDAARCEPLLRALDRAVAMLAEGRNDRGERILAALETEGATAPAACDPLLVEAGVTRLGVLGELGRYADAAALAEALASSGSLPPEAHDYLEGMRALASHEPTDEHPPLDAAFAALDRDPASARPLWSAALAVAPDDALALTGSGLGRLALGDAKGARRDLDRALAQHELATGAEVEPVAWWPLVPEPGPATPVTLLPEGLRGRARFEGPQGAPRARQWLGADEPAPVAAETPAQPALDAGPWAEAAPSGLRALLPADAEHPVRVLELALGTERRLPVAGRCALAVLSGDAAALACGEPGAAGEVLLVASDGSLARFALGAEARALALAGELVAVAEPARTLVLVRRGAALELARAFEGGASALALLVSPARALLLRADGDTLRLADVASGAELLAAPKRCDRLRALPGELVQCGAEVLAPNGAPVAYRGPHPILLAVDGARQQALVAAGDGTPPAPRPFAAPVALPAGPWSETPDGRFAVVSYGHALGVHALATGERLATWVPTRHGVAAFVPGGRVELWGEPGPALGCRFDDVLTVFEVCRERAVAPGAVWQALTGGRGYLEP